MNSNWITNSWLVKRVEETVDSCKNWISPLINQQSQQVDSSIRILLEIAQSMGEMNQVLLQIQPFHLIHSVNVYRELRRLEEEEQDQKQMINNNNNNMVIPLDDQLTRSMRFAFAAYGLDVVRLLGYKTADRVQSNQDLVGQLVGNDVKCIDADWTSSLDHPAYYLAVDHQNQQIVLAIRGSISVYDFIGDLRCQYVSLPNYPGVHVHKGIYHYAQWFDQHLFNNTIIEQLSNNKDYSLIVTGHSLGAGVATLLTLIWHDKLNQLLLDGRSIIHCYAFAPPCCVSKELHQQYPNNRQLITSVVLQNDLVCRLNTGTVRDFYQSIANLSQDRQLRVLCKDNEKHYPAGQIVLLEQKNNEQVSRLISFEQLSLLPMDPDMLQDHSPMRYVESIQSK